MTGTRTSSECVRRRRQSLIAYITRQTKVRTGLPPRWEEYTYNARITWRNERRVNLAASVVMNLEKSGLPSLATSEGRTGTD